jgi:hypothetical protein
MVYDATVTIAALVHISFGAIYLGLDIVTEIALVPAMRGAKNAAELATHQSLFGKLTPLFGAFGGGALITGLAFLFIKFGTDLAVLWQLPESRTIVFALVLFLGLTVVAGAVFQPFSKWFLKLDLASQGSGPVPAEFNQRMERLDPFLHGQTAGILVVLVLMVVAANGGI